MLSISVLLGNIREWSLDHTKMGKGLVLNKKELGKLTNFLGGLISRIVLSNTPLSV